MRLLPCRLSAMLAWLLCVSLFSSAAAFAAQSNEDGLRKQLEHRWFEIEIIIFERLDVLEINTSEKLVQTSTRIWPNNLREMDTPRSTRSRQPGRIGDFDPDKCIGYPDIPADEVHATTEFSDETLRSRFDTDGSDDVESAAQTAAELEALAATELLDEDVSTEVVQPEPPTPADIFTQHLQDYERELLASSYRWLDNPTMVNDLKALNRQAKLRPILHGRWRQPVPTRDNPQPIYLSSAIDERSPLTLRGSPKVAGHVSVTVGRYLHFAPTLWYHADNLGLKPIVLPNLSLERGDPAIQGEPYLELAESRRLRSETLHYLDHPKLGVIVRIDPIQIDPGILAEFDALQALQEGVD